MKTFYNVYIVPTAIYGMTTIFQDFKRCKKSLKRLFSMFWQLNGNNIPEDVLTLEEHIEKTDYNLLHRIKYGQAETAFDFDQIIEHTMNNTRAGQRGEIRQDCGRLAYEKSFIPRMRKRFIDGDFDKEDFEKSADAFKKHITEKILQRRQNT